MPVSSMRAAVYRGRNNIALESRERPQPAAGEVRVRLRACGLCGSDLHLLHTELPFLAPGLTMGHEMAGTVDRLGDGVSGLTAGESVAIEPLSTCGTCAWCRAGRDSICPAMQLFGIHKHGGFASYITVPAHRLFPVPEGIGFALAALSEPVAVAVHGLRIAGFQPGQRVLVLGAGTIGLAVAGVARAWGAGEILISARHTHQARCAESLGATRVLSERESSVEALSALAPSRSPEIVVETVGGSANTLAAAAAAVAPGGTVSVLGLFLEPVRINPLPLLLKETALQWSNCYSRSPAQRDFEESIRLIAADSGKWSSLLTHGVPLEEIAEAFALAGDKKSGAIKVTVLME